MRRDLMSATPKHQGSDKATPLRVAAESGDKERPFVEASRTFVNDRQGQEPGWINQERFEDLTIFERDGFPHKRIEEWKFTDLRAQMREPLPLVDLQNSKKVTGRGGPFAELDVHRIVIVDGTVQSGFPEAPGLEMVDLLTADQDADWAKEEFSTLSGTVRQAMTSLSTAAMTTCLGLRVRNGQALDKPIHLVSISTQSNVQHHTRILVVLEEGADATLIEEHFGEGGEDYFSGQVSEFFVGADARLHHYKVQSEADSAIHVANIFAGLGEGAKLESFYLNGGGRLARNDITVRLSGEHANYILGTAYMAGDQQHTDTTAVVDHAVPHCTSRQVVRGCLTDKARGVFQGKIIVQEGAQKTDGYQMSKALLLSDRAEVDAKPELEIYADDVKCSHGATAGELDEDALFYLRSRGVPLAEAKALLVEGFLDDAIDEISDDRVKAPLKSIVARWLREHGHFEGEAHNE